METFSHVKTIKDLMESDYDARITEIADYITKRLCPVDKGARFAMRAKKVVSPLIGESVESLSRIFSLTKIIIEKYGEMHPENKYTEEEVEAICNASIFHDIGKTMLPEDVLMKPDKLLPEEIAVVQRHTEYGYDIIKKIPQLSENLFSRYYCEIARYHHERWDGNGYSFGLQKEQIPICVQAVSIVDAYDALISHRDYKPTYSHDAAVEMIESGECGSFGPEILACFKAIAGELQAEAERYKTMPHTKQRWLYRSLKQLNRFITYVLIGSVILISVNIVVFAVNLFNTVYRDKVSQLEIYTQDVANICAQKLNGDISVLNQYAIINDAVLKAEGVGTQSDPYQFHQDASGILSQIAKNNNYEYFGYYLKSGAVGSGLPINGLDFETLKLDISIYTEVAKQTAIIQPCQIVDGTIAENCVYISYPIYYSEISSLRSNVAAFVVCAFKMDSFLSMLELDRIGYNNFLQIFNWYGSYTLKPDFIQGDNFYDSYREIPILDGINIDDVYDLITKNNASDVMHFRLNKTDYYGYFAPFNQTNATAVPGTENWYVMLSVKDSIIGNYVSSIQSSMIWFFLIIGASLFVLAFVVSYKLRQSLKTTREIAEQYEQIRESFELSESKYKMLLAQAKYMVFEVDHESKVVTHNVGTVSRYGIPAVYKHDDKAPIMKDYIHPDDFESYQKMYHDIFAGKETAETNLRLRLPNGQYIWNRCSMHNIYNEDKHAVKSIGFVEDINTYMSENISLKDSVRRDSFTGLYNKGYTETIINKLLAASQKRQESGVSCINALFIMDLDKFKRINDTYGHVMGDIIIKNFSKLLKKVTRATDVVGRIGGDEFVCFMPDIKDEKTALDRISVLLGRISEIGEGRIESGISVGVAFSPTDGITYRDLYLSADKAMYVSKNSGGNRWTTTSGRTGRGQIES